MECHVSHFVGNFTLQASLLLPSECHWLGLFGPSGAGKSSLLRALGGLEPDAQVSGQWQGLTLSDARQTVLVSAQTPLFPAISVWQNLQLVATHNQQTADQTDWAIDSCECRQLLKKMPGDLSGGELQRVKLARAILTDPALLLLDESFSAMDSALKQRIQWRLRYEWTSSARVIMVSHDPNDMIRCCQQMVLISDGSVVSQGDIATTLSHQLPNLRTDAAVEHALPLASVLKGPFYAESQVGVQFKIGDAVITSSEAAVRDNTDKIAMLVPASQVVLSRSTETVLSLPNRLTGKVTALEPVSEQQQKVSLLCERQPLIAVVDTAVVGQMQLQTGDTVTAHFASRFEF